MSWGSSQSNYGQSRRMRAEPVRGGLPVILAIFLGMTIFWGVLTAFSNTVGAYLNLRSLGNLNTAASVQYVPDKGFVVPEQSTDGLMKKKIVRYLGVGISVICALMGVGALGVGTSSFKGGMVAKNGILGISIFVMIVQVISIGVAFFSMFIPGENSIGAFTALIWGVGTIGFFAAMLTYSLLANEAKKFFVE